jgi:hypothetical protein
VSKLWLDPSETTTVAYWKVLPCRDGEPVFATTERNAHCLTRIEHWSQSVSAPIECEPVVVIDHFLYPVRYRWGKYDHVVYHELGDKAIVAAMERFASFAKLLAFIQRACR